jgi:hypothetical protein
MGLYTCVAQYTHMSCVSMVLLCCLSVANEAVAAEASSLCTLR